MTERPGVEHVHEWQPLGVVTETESAVIELGTRVPRHRSIQVAVQSCPCGALKRTVVSRGDWR